MAMSLRQIADYVGRQTNSNPALHFARYGIESTHGTSELAKYHNYGGYKAYEGRPTTPDGIWMAFDSDEDFAEYDAAMMGDRYFNLTDAQDEDDYINRLAQGGYIVGADIDNYRAGMPTYLEAYNNGEDYGTGDENALQAQVQDSFDDGLSSTQIDWSVWTHNHGGEDNPANIYDSNASTYSARVRTDTRDLRPEAIHGLNKIGAEYGWAHPEITGGAETWTHANGTYSHHTGWKADIVIPKLIGGTELGNEFIQFCNSNGWIAIYENAGTANAHWDIDFSGHDTRDPYQKVSLGLAGKGSNFWNTYAPLAGDNGGRWAEYEENRDPVVDRQPQTPIGFWDMMVSNFADTVFTSSAARIGQLLWGGIVESNSLGHYDTLSQADYDMIVNSPLSKDTQKFIMLNARDSREVQWLLKQRMEEQKRKQTVAQWRAQNDNILLSGLSYIAGAGGMLLDPMTYLPIGTAVKGAKMAERLGAGLLHAEKANVIARLGAQRVIDGVINYGRNGAVAASAVLGDDLLKTTFSEDKPDYAQDAALAFIGGTAIDLLGRGLSSFRSKSGSATMNNVVQKAEQVEAHAMLDAADLTEAQIAKIGSETHGEALKLHDAFYSPSLGKQGKLLRSLEENDRVVATTWKKAHDLVFSYRGIEIPKDAKAFYVPNEDYAFVLTDRVKPEEVNKLLQHEFAVHAGLKKMMGKSAYSQLMSKIQKAANTEGTMWNEEAKIAGSYDPEEILAQVVEDARLEDATWSTLHKTFNKVFKKNNMPNLSMQDIKEIVKAQTQQHRLPSEFYVNPDGSTAFAGLKFSQDNLLNPVNIVKGVTDIKDVRAETESAFKGKALKWFADKMEQGIFGRGISSVSNTLRHYTPQLWDDARGRGLGKVETITAENHKKYIMGKLYAPYLDVYVPARTSWCLANRRMGYAANTAFDAMVRNAYNAKYAKNTAMVIDNIPEEVNRAVEALHDLRTQMINFGKQSSSMVGSRKGNLINKDWYAVDDELWRRVDADKLAKFYDNFIATHDKDVPTQVRDFLTKYIQTYAKRDVIHDELVRAKKLKNIRIQKANERMEQRLNDGDASTEEYKPQELIDEKVTDDEVEKWLKDHTAPTITHLFKGYFDLADPKNLKGSKLGDLSFLRQRIPLDTTGVLKMPNGLDFSFDNNLQQLSMDDIVLKTISRFAGEAATKAIFGTEKHLKNFFTRVGRELDTAKTLGKISQNKVDNTNKELKDAINELRGTRSGDETAMGHAGAIAHIFRNLSYAKNGAMMGLNQFGELAGSMMYGGVSQLFRIFKPLGEFMENVKYGKVTAENLRNIERYVYGAHLEREVWGINWRDRVVHDALTEKNIGNSILTWVADKTANLGKITSSINMLPQMTDSMERGMRIQTMMDSFDWALGKKFSKLRNPFSKAKLKAAHVNEKDAQAIKDSIKKYLVIDENGAMNLDIKKWQEENMHTYLKWYNMIQMQQERAIVSATRQGNKNLFKNRNAMTQMLLQFKDYSLRAMNGQFFRVMTSREVDDALAATMSIISNTMVYLARVGLTYGAYNLTGLHDKAEKYKENALSTENLIKAIATRSTLLGTPLSFANDVYEAFAGGTSVRTTVNRGAKNKEQPRDASDIAGDFISQLPAIKEGFSVPMGVYEAAKHGIDGDMTQKDFKKLLQIIPVPNMIGVSQLMDLWTQHTGLPEKRPKTK